MPGGNFWSDKCQEDKCPDEFFGRTNARRTNAWSHFLVGQMPGGQMPGVTIWSDKCQEDKCLNPHLVRTNAWTHTDPGRGGGQMPRRTNAWRTNASMDKCQYRHLSYKAFVFRGICLLTHCEPTSPYRKRSELWARGQESCEQISPAKKLSFTKKFSKIIKSFSKL